MQDFLTLRAFASEALGMSIKPNQADVEISLQLNEKYARAFAKTMNANFDIKRFDCRDNGIVRSMHCVTENGSVEVSLSKDVMTNSTVLTSIIKENNEMVVNTSSYSLFSEFTEALNKILSRCDKTA